MTTLTAFDWLVLVGLVLLVAVWLVRRIRASLKASCCSTDTSSCAGCSGGCGKRNPDPTGSCPPASDNEKPD